MLAVARRPSGQPAVSDREIATAAVALASAINDDAAVAKWTRSESITAAAAALQVARFAMFHRAAELFLERELEAPAIVTGLSASPDDGICAALAVHDDNEVGAAWAGRVFMRLFNAPERRPRGQFFTPIELATFMARWAITRADAKVLDPGSGPGLLLATAARRLEELGGLRPADQLVGVELCPLASTFAQVCLYPAGAAPRLIEADFLTMPTSDERYDAIVCNPPYTRHQGLAGSYKEAVGAVVDKLVDGHLNRRAGLYVHFLVRAISMLAPGGRLAFITPREFLDAHYGAMPKGYLLRRCRLRALVLFDPTSAAAFPGVDTTSAFTLVERGEPDAEPVRVVHVHGIPSADELADAVEARVATTYSWGSVARVERRLFLQEERWSALLPGQGPSAQTSDEVPLGDLVAVKRGIATGANHYFVLSTQQVRTAGLPRSSIRPAIGHSRLARGTRITKANLARWSEDGEHMWLLDVRGVQSHPKVVAYLAAGEVSGVPLGFLCRTRERWYEMEKREVPPILMTYMSKGSPRFLRNDAAVMPLNVFHGLYPKDLSSAAVTRLLTYLRSPAFGQKIRRGARTYSDGLLKIEPRELAAVTVPDVRR